MIVINYIMIFLLGLFIAMYYAEKKAIKVSHWHYSEILKTFNTSFEQGWDAGRAYGQKEELVKALKRRKVS